MKKKGSLLFSLSLLRDSGDLEEDADLLTPAQTAEIQSFSLQKAVETATVAGYSVVGTGNYWQGYRTGRKYFILPCGAGATTDAYGSIDTFWLYAYSDGTLSR